MRTMSTERGTLIVEIRCFGCERDYWVEMTQDQYHEWYFDNHSRLVQAVFPDHSTGDRDLLLMSICTKCFESKYDPDGDE